LPWKQQQQSVWTIYYTNPPPQTTNLVQLQCVCDDFHEHVWSGPSTG
jgi:hypothetical protein